MNIFSRISITRRLYLASFLLIIVLSGAASVAWWSMSQVKGLTNTVTQNRAPQLANISALEFDIIRLSVQLRQILTADGDAQKGLDDIVATRNRAEKDFNAFRDGIFTDAGKQVLAKIQPVVNEFMSLVDMNLQMIRDGKKEESLSLFTGKTIPVRDQLLAVTDEEKHRENKNLILEMKEVEDLAGHTRERLVMIFMVIAVGVILLSAYIGRVLLTRVAQAQQVATRVRDGDLTGDIVDAAKDEFSPLLASLAEMKRELVMVVSSVRQGSEQVATASAEIANGNHDLSSRTEQQAANLEETAGSMSELSATVKQNAEGANEANQLAKNASLIATEGGAVVEKVVETMKGINASSQKIADIIQVIDGIAFQTNILALNAAVEAARAGEQGRGFAVVASEVRTLAGRSAQAAKEIKALIGESVDQVKQGTALVDHAGATMQDVVAAIRRVTEIMGAISAASHEQSLGVSQVEVAVLGLDDVTQQNAALVEQMAAAASSLKGQADELVNVVARFTLEQQTTTQFKQTVKPFAAGHVIAKAKQAHATPKKVGDRQTPRLSA